MTHHQLFEYHPLIAYKFIPNLKVRIPHESGGYLVQTNRMGFRSNHEFMRERNPQKKRVLVFGDSFTAGDGVSNGKRYTDIIEKLIPSLEVYNFGVSGTGSDQHYLIWREFARDTEHDVMVIAVLVENIRRIVARYRRYLDEEGRRVLFAKPYFVLEGDKLVLKGCPPKREALREDELPPEEQPYVERGGRFELIRRVINQLGIKDFVHKLTHYQPFPEYDSPDHPAWLLMKAILRQWVEEYGQKERVILMPIPLYYHIEESCDATPYRRRFEEVAEELGVHLHDPLPDFWAYPPEVRRAFRFEKDIHPTPEGHRVLAESLKKSIEKVLGLNLSFS
ncbi:MAG: SGNH/GDSL hydrolase family protein [Sandaracinaceae bacterium]|nr:SGNH/GDSL hydrolase family protein [Sandaracinaceae bacterium]